MRRDRSARPAVGEQSRGSFLHSHNATRVRYLAVVGSMRADGRTFFPFNKVPIKV